jgi:para-nitrobenzyl esterase
MIRVPELTLAALDCHTAARATYFLAREVMTRVSAFAAAVFLMAVIGNLPVHVQAPSSATTAATEPVRLDTGLVSGMTGTSGEIRIFKGIPFAAPPVGALRWQPPQPAARWNGVRKAEQFGPRCMQGGGPGGQPMSEDCLTVNVWTGARSASERRPVMVWSYGGAFAGGAGSLPGYDGENLAKKGVVLVTYNYRLGPFGWFSHPELSKASGHNASGNQGLMDAIAVLKWVQKNIAAFGGDPKNVTIFGESAGGALVAAMLGSPEAKGLFQRAIAESAGWMGVSMAPMLTLAEAEQAGVQLASSLGANSLAELRAKGAEELQKGGRGQRPLVDGWYIREDLSMTFAQGKQHEADVLVGSNKDEGTFPFFGVNAESARKFGSAARDRWGDQSDAFLKLYPAGSETESNTSQLAAFRDELSWHMRMWAELQAKRGKSRAYVYYFTHEPPAAGNQPSRGATHTAEIPYVFNNLPTNREWPEADRKLADQMSTYWVNFAAKGDPNGKGLPVWPAYKDKASGRAMILGPTLGPESAPEAARWALYDALWIKQRSRTTGGSR